MRKWVSNGLSTKKAIFHVICTHCDLRILETNLDRIIVRVPQESQQLVRIIIRVQSN